MVGLRGGGGGSQKKINKMLGGEGWGRGERSLFKWLVNGGVGIEAGGVGVHELGGVMWGHGGHAAGVCCVRDAGHDGHDLGYLLL